MEIIVTIVALAAFVIFIYTRVSSKDEPTGGSGGSSSGGSSGSPKVRRKRPIGHDVR